MKILIASHGSFASGLYSSLKIIAGERDNITTIDAFLDDTPLKALLSNYFDTLSNDEEVVVLTDLVFGSVNQEITAYMATHNVKIISGVNLALALEVINKDSLSDSDILEIIESSKSNIIYVNNLVNSSSTNDDFDDLL